MTLIRTEYGAGALPSADATFLAEVKAWATLDFADDDDLVAKLINEAFAYLDGAAGATGRTLINSTYDLVLDCFPCGPIELARPPVTAVTSVVYRDSNGVDQTLEAGTDYRVNRLGVGSTRALVVPLNGWPSVDRGGDTVTVTYTAGQGATPSDLPADVHAVVKSIVAYRYRYREEADAIPAGPAFMGLLRSISLIEVV